MQLAYICINECNSNNIFEYNLYEIQLYQYHIKFYICIYLINYYTPSIVFYMAPFTFCSVFEEYHLTLIRYNLTLKLSVYS